jgi:hypothetical protein
LFASSAFAQVGSAVLTGKIIDASTKAPVADAVVTVTSPSLQGEQLMVTDASGLYRIPGLPPGEYTIRLDKETYKPYSRAGIQLRADTTIQVSAEVLPEAIKEEIVVVGDPPTVDIGSSSTGTNISSEFVRRVPVAQPGTKGSQVRSFESAAEVAPGARFDDYGTSINGASSPENRYVIDGVSVNDPAFGINGTPLSLEFIQETNVITGGYMPEYGRTTGGFLNVVTKSGSNEFHGSIFGYLSPGVLQADRKRIRTNGNTITTDIRLKYQWDAGFDIGGPLIKDKLWFYAGFDYFETKWELERNLNRFLIDVDPETGEGAYRVDPATGFLVTERIPGAEKFYEASESGFQYIGKLGYAIDRDNRVSIEMFGMPRFSGGDGAFGINPRRDTVDDLDLFERNVTGTYGAMAHSFDSWTNDVIAKYQTAFDNKHTLLDVSLGWHHQQGGIFPADGSSVDGSGGGLAAREQIYWLLPRSITDLENVPNGDTLCAAQGGLFPCPTPPIYYGGGPDILQDQTMNRYQANFVVTRLLRLAGHHVLKAGVDAEMTTYKTLNAYSGGRRLVENPHVDLDGNLTSVTFGEGRQFGFLKGPDDPVFQNGTEFDARSFTVGGFLQDSWSILDQVTLNAGVRYDVQVLYNDNGDVAMVVPNQWSPRIGAIYDFTRDGRSKVYANYGRYYESVPLNIAQRALTGDATVYSELNPNPNCDPLNPAVPSDPSNPADCVNNPVGDRVNPNNEGYASSRVWQQQAGGRAPVDPDLKAQSSDEIVLGAEYEVIPSGRLGLSYTHRYINHVIEDLSSDEAASFYIGNPGYGMASSFPKARRDYDAVSLYFEKNWKREWLAQGSYTVSWLRGNYAGLYRPENFQLDPNMNSTYDLESLIDNADGPLPGDHRHQLKLFGAKQFSLPKGMAITTGIGYRGRSGGPTNYFGAHSLYGPKEALVLPRGSGERTPWVHSIDPHVGYAVDITKDSTFEIAVDVFNVFNFQAVTRVDEVFTTQGVRPIRDGSRGDIAGCKDPARGDCNLETADGSPLQPDQINANHGNPIAYQEPLTVRFGARLTF